MSPITKLVDIASRESFVSSGLSLPLSSVGELVCLLESLCLFVFIIFTLVRVFLLQGLSSGWNLTFLTLGLSRVSSVSLVLLAGKKGSLGTGISTIQISKEDRKNNIHAWKLIVTGK